MGHITWSIYLEYGRGKSMDQKEALKKIRSLQFVGGQQDYRDQGFNNKQKCNYEESMEY